MNRITKINQLIHEETLLSTKLASKIECQNVLEV